MIVLRKRGEFMQVDYATGPHRLRGSLGTKNRDVALRLKNRLENALAEGPESGKWTELRKILPASTFQKFADYSGVTKNHSATWSSLREIYEDLTNQRVQMKKLRERSRERYFTIVEVFQRFLDLRGIEDLSDITPAIIDDYKGWRLRDILSKSKSRDGSSLAQETVMLESIFKMAVQREMLVKNPVKHIPISISRGVHGAEPFSAEDLQMLRKAANDDLDTFLVLRWTGLRASDICSFAWKHVFFRRREIEKKTEKRGKVVVIPMHKELYSCLENLHERFSPASSDLVLEPVFTRRTVNRFSLYSLCVSMGVRAGLASNCTPHRFRDTMAVDMLLRGATMYDVAKVLGDTVDVVEQHYTPFVTSLRDRIKGLLDKDDEGLEKLASGKRTNN